MQEVMWEVIVGNCGMVHRGTIESYARATYHEYVAMAKQPFSRISGESVVLMRDGELVLEYQGTNPIE